MAEAFLRKYGGKAFEAHSAGLDPKGVNPFTVRVMNEIGVNMENHRSKGVTEYLGKVHFHTLITVCDHAERNCPTVWPGVNQRIHWSFEDPAAAEGSDAEKLSVFRAVRDQIEAQVKAWVQEQTQNS
jgi:arsenate reductase